MRTARHLAWVTCLLGTVLLAEDWPTLGHDNRRSHVTGDIIRLPLTSAWTVRSDRPRTAWPGPAKWDAYAEIKNLASMRNFDPSPAVTVAGEHLWYGSTVDDAVHCLKAESGEEIWSFTTDGPVRLPPSWHDGRLYLASDDGVAYCLDAASGQLVWSYAAVAQARRLMMDGKLISTWPCRTGILVQDGRAFFAASLLPWRPSYLCAVDAVTGRLGGSGTYRTAHEGMTMQGPLAASSDRLFVSQGRQQPIVCDLASGTSLGPLGRSGEGGVWGLVTDEGEFMHGRGQNHGADGDLRGFDGGSRESVASFPKAHRLAITGACVYVLGQGKLQAFDRGRYLRLQRDLAVSRRQRQADENTLKKLADNVSASERAALQETIAAARASEATMVSELGTCTRWEVGTDCPNALILAGNLVFAGGENRVVAYAATDGREVWRAPVEGTAHALAAAGGKLFVSTDTGAIHCFAGTQTE